jgi:2'-5' RNA ligase
MRDTDKRLFVSIDLPQFIKDHLKRSSQPGVYWIKWMNPGNLHITLSFLGDLKPGQIETAKRVLAEVVPRFAPFSIKLDKVVGERDMLWLEPDNPEKLIELQTELKNSLKQERLGKREKWSYTPHVLWAKSKTGRRMTWQPQNFVGQEFTAEKVNLYESQLTPGAATHTLLASWPLSETAPQHEN